MKTTLRYVFFYLIEVGVAVSKFLCQVHKQHGRICIEFEFNRVMSSVYCYNFSGRHCFGRRLQVFESFNSFKLSSVCNVESCNI